MRAVTYISSAGLRVVLSSAKRAKAAKGGLAVFGLQPAVKEVFEVSGCSSKLPEVSSVRTAVSASDWKLAGKPKARQLASRRAGLAPNPRFA